MATKSKDVNDIINDQIIKTGEKICKAYGTETSLPCFLHRFLTLLAYKIYEAAPSNEDAEVLMQHSINEAKELWIKQQA